MNETGVTTYPEPPSGTIDGAPIIHTPSRAWYGLGGRFDFQASISLHNDKLSCRSRMPEAMAPFRGGS